MTEDTEKMFKHTSIDLMWIEDCHIIIIKNYTEEITNLSSYQDFIKRLSKLVITSSQFQIITSYTIKYNKCKKKRKKNKTISCI